MQLMEAYARIKSLKQPIFRTRNIAAFLKINIATASKILNRLSKQKHVVHLLAGVWGIPEQIDPLMLPEYLVAPFPCYISLQSALYYHGMITQIPAVIYAVSPARTKRYNTILGSVSIHHVKPNFFFDYKVVGKNGIKIATPEKALLDICYLSATKTKLFCSLPELEFPENFDHHKIKQIIGKIKSANKKTLMANCFAKYVES